MAFFKIHTNWLYAAFFMLLFAFNAQAQDSIKVLKGEEVEVAKIEHSPKKATLYSTILPGLGQAYNKKYWKIPIIYAAMGTSVYFIVWNTQYYNEFKTAFDTREAGGTDKYYNVYSTQNLITIQNYYRNNRDLSIIITVLIYGLNILDANIGAHLYAFDVSDDLSMRIEPTMIQNRGLGYVGNNFGMRLSLQF